ncbi:MAG: hypothetical protein HQ502_07600 [Alphaproteobacteria bacterium]|nr:hypothetical protein [Alphaproteobacteria bacterium]
MKFRTTTELLIAARHIEEAASARYEHLAAEMARLGKVEVAETFQALAAGMRLRLQAIADNNANIGETGVQAMEAPLEFFAAFPDDDDDIDERYAMTPQQALNLAIRAEERNLTAYAQIAGQAENTEVIKLAEHLANDGLDQLRQLRLSRRRINRTRAAGVYRQQIEELARRAMGTVDTEAPMQGIIATLARRLTVVGALAAKISPNDAPRIAEAAALVAAIQPAQALFDETSLSSEDDPFLEPPAVRAVADVEIAFDTLMSVADTGRDEQTLRQALAFAAALIPVFQIVRRDEP